MRMRSFASVLIPGFLWAPVHAQITTVFTETFETNGQFSLSPGWVWDGNAPVARPACTGVGWSAKKDVHGPNDTFWGGFGARWMFHPLPVDPLALYDVSLQAEPVGPWGDSVSVYAMVLWWDTLQGNPWLGGASNYTTVYSCAPAGQGFYVPPAGPPGSQLGVLIYAFTWSNMQMAIDQVVVRKKPWKAQFAGSMMLAGPYDPLTQTMSDALRQQGLIPLTEPYSALGWPQASGGGGETTTTAVLNAQYTGGRVVDWVRLELRKFNDPTVLMATRQALLLQNGSVITAAGSPSVLFDIAPGNYYVVVRHRNHLAAMTASPYTVTYPGGGVWSYPFDHVNWPTHGTNARQIHGTKALLWPGNANPDGVLKYAGSANDRDRILVAVGGNTPTNTITGYHLEDVNLDGVVKYTGAVNDRDRLLLALPGQVPTATRVQQLP
ncbi:MAG: hypothetical protein IT227_13620 [Flavobacteriales bacterium]|nr:hypothetical protein [Flavobacteriales bacterium]